MELLRRQHGAVEEATWSFSQLTTQASGRFLRALASASSPYPLELGVGKLVTSPPPCPLQAIYLPLWLSQSPFPVFLSNCISRPIPIESADSRPRRPRVPPP